MLFSAVPREAMHTSRLCRPPSWMNGLIRAEVSATLAATNPGRPRTCGPVRHGLDQGRYALDFERGLNGGRLRDDRRLVGTATGTTQCPPGPVRHDDGRGVGTSIWHQCLLRILADPYYAGHTFHDGHLYPGRHPGRHPALISQTLFDRVQDVLDTRSSSSVRQRTHHHWLKGILRCDRCHLAGRDSRLVYTEATGRSGIRYAYYLCRGPCELRHLQLARVENAVGRYIIGLELPTAFTDAIEAELAQALADEKATDVELHTNLTNELATLDAVEDRLLDALQDGTLPSSKLRERLNTIHEKRSAIEERSVHTRRSLTIGATALRNAVKLCATSNEIYHLAEDEPDARAMILQALVQVLYINEEPEITGDIPTRLVQQLRDAHTTWATQQATKAPERRKVPQPTTGTPSQHQPFPTNPNRGIEHATGSSRTVMVELRVPGFTT